MFVRFQCFRRRVKTELAELPQKMSVPRTKNRFISLERNRWPDPPWHKTCSTQPVRRYGSDCTHWCISMQHITGEPPNVSPLRRDLLSRTTTNHVTHLLLVVSRRTRQSLSRYSHEIRDRAVYFSRRASVSDRRFDAEFSRADGRERRAISAIDAGSALTRFRKQRKRLR